MSLNQFCRSCLASVLLIFNFLFSFGQLSGTYTIGGNSPNYPTIDSACKAIVKAGISGPTVFKIRAGNYARFKLDSISGSSSVNTLTLEPDSSKKSGVTVSGTNTSSKNYMVYFDNCEHVFIRHLKIVCNSSTYANVVRYRNGANNVTLDSCEIEGPRYSGNSISWRDLIWSYTAGVPNTNNRILNCKLKGGTNAISVAGGTNQKPNQNWEIKNNVITDWSVSGIIAGGVHNGLKITGNRIISASSIRNGAIGISISTLNSSLITGNFVQHQGQLGGKGIYVQNVSDSGKDRTLMANNVITNTHLGLGVRQYTGIETNNCDSVEVIFNSLYSASGNGVLIKCQNSKGVKIQNNAGYGKYQSASLYSNSSTPILGYNNLIAFKKRNIPLPSTSYEILPNFLSSVNLKPDCFEMNGNARYDLRVTEDYSGRKRDSLKPDIGAYEFDIPALNCEMGGSPIEAFCYGPQDIKFSIRNVGTVNLSRISIGWALKANSGSFVFKGSKSFNLNLPVGKDTLLIVDTVSFSADTTYQYRAWCYSPNNGTDNVNSNDTSRNFTARVGLSGTYTVGGLSSDFFSIKTAFEALNQKGVCGPVVLNVAPGQYGGPLKLTTVLGTSSTNTILVQKDTSKSGEIKVVVNSGSTNFNALNIDKVSYLTIKDFKIFSSAFTTIKLTQRASHITLSDNVVYNRYGNRSYGVVLSADHVDFLTLENNVISGGNTGLSILGNSIDKSKPRAAENVIKNNRLDTIGEAGIYMAGLSDVTLEGNQLINSITINSSGPFIESIKVVDCKNFKVSRNRIQVEKPLQTTGNRSQALYVSKSGSTSLNRSSIDNNVIIIGDHEFGIKIEDSKNIDIVHNTLLSKDRGVAKFLEIRKDTSINIFNNIFHNPNNLYSSNWIKVDQISAIDSCNYNNVKMQNRYGSIGATSYYSFQDWKNATGFDSKSQSVNPMFRNKPEYKPTNLKLNSTGKVLSNFNKDYESNSRSMQAVDIGCVEFTPTQNDIDLAEIESYSACLGNNPIKLRIRNAGQQKLDSFKVSFSVKTNNGAYINQGIYLKTLSLQYNEDTVIDIGSFTFAKSTDYYIKAWVTSVNGGVDEDKSNDTIVSGKLRTKMAGTFTVGGVNPDYANILAALNDIRGGICGPVTFNVRVGSYNNRILLHPIPGASEHNTITIQTEPGANGQAEFYDSQPIRFYRCEYYTLKNLKIRTTAGTSAIESYYKENNHNRISGCTVVGSVQFAYDHRRSAIYIRESAGLNMLIDSNKITNGTNGIYILGGGGTVDSSSKIEISDNHIAEFFQNGVLGNNKMNIKIRKNTVENKSSTIYTTPTGLKLSGCFSSEIIGNKIFISRNYGIELRSCFGSSGSPSLIANNFIGQSDTSNSQIYTGIEIVGGSHLKVVYNSELLNSQHGYCLRIRSSSTGNEVKNNCFVNLKGSSMRLPSGVKSDYNNHFIGGFNFGNYNSTTYRTLSAWVAGSGQDSNSVAVDPLYVSDTNFHFKNHLLDEAGTRVQFVTTDFDLELRDSIKPDIGADERKIGTVDAALTFINSGDWCADSSNVAVQINNAGKSVINNLKLNWYVKKDQGVFIKQKPFYFMDSLKVRKDSIVIIGKSFFEATHKYEILVVVDSVNGGIDNIIENDTIGSSSVFIKYGGTYHIGGKNATWQTVDSAFSALEFHGICGPVVLYLDSGTYDEKVYINEIPGASANSWVTLIGDTIKGQPVFKGNYPELIFDYANYVRITNIKFFECMPAINFRHPNTNIDIDSNIFIGKIYAQTNNGGAIIRDGSQWINIPSVQKSIIIQRNVIKRGGVGILFAGNSIRNAFDQDISIVDNKISGFNNSGIWLDNIRDVTVLRNEVIVDSSAIYGSGVMVRSVRNLEFERNNIHSITGRYGIYFWYNNINTYKVELTNNFISNINRDSSFAILSYASDVDFYHNNIHISSGHKGSTAFRIDNTSRGTLKNNIISCSDSGNVFFVHNWGRFSGGNNAYYAGPGAVFTSTGGFPNLTTFKDWQNRMLDTVSINLNPGFISNRDLHVRNNNLANNGDSLGIATDIDGDIRHIKTPTIGADEISLPASDLELNNLSKRGKCVGSTTVKVDVKNWGLDTISYLRIAWSISENRGPFVNQVAITSTDTLFPLNDTALTLGKYTYDPKKHYRILVFIDSSNASGDLNSFNDTILIPVITDPLPIVSLDTMKSICVNQPFFVLQGGKGLPANGTGKYFGNGVSSSGQVFFPDSAGVGKHKIGFVYISNLGCKDTAFTDLKIDSLPRINLSTPSSICFGDTAKVSASPVGGNYIGSIINNVYYSLKAKLDSVGYSYKDTVTGCTDSIFNKITVDSLPIVSISKWNSVCENDSSFAAYGGLPLGGSYSGNAIIGLHYYPAKAKGSIDTVKYRFTDLKGCSSGDSVFVAILPKPNVNVTTESTCNLDTAITLSAGLPIGGNYFGTYVNAGKFNSMQSGPGQFNAYYALSDTNKCTDTATFQVIVFRNPIFNLGNDTILCKQQKLTLSSNLGGLPHVWNTGALSTFIVVNKTGTYALRVTDTTTNLGCSFSDTVNVKHQAICLSVDENNIHNTKILLYPNPNKGEFTISVETGVDFSEIAIFNYIGQSIPFKEIRANEGSTNIKMVNANSGYYFLVLGNEENKHTVKFQVE